MKSHRPERVANIIRQVVSDAIANKLSDPRIEPLSSVTRVEVSGDLEYAKVFVSVMGEAGAGRRTMAGLNSATGAVQRMVARKLPIRHCPRLSFHLDESIKRAAETIRLIDASMAEAQTQAESAEAAGPEAPTSPPCGDDA
jgi:ribosome-binding factor A